jgi:hypothetical protein
MATAGATLVLAGATFLSVRSANRAARVAERSLLAGLRPLLLPAHPSDEIDKVTWIDRHVARVTGGRAIFEEADGVIYLAAGVRNAGAGIAVLHGWYLWPFDSAINDPPVDVAEFRRLSRDLYVAAGDAGFWQAAIRDGDDRDRVSASQFLAVRERALVDLLYGDYEGGQRTISRFSMLPAGDDGWLWTVARHWNLDRADPR